MFDPLAIIRWMYTVHSEKPLATELAHAGGPILTGLIACDYIIIMNFRGVH